MIVAIGNSPSSGSTLLADLLDSTRHGICGPELRLFANARAYDFERFQKNIWSYSTPASIYVLKNRIRFEGLPGYRLTPESFAGMVRRAGSFPDLAYAFRKHSINARQKSDDAIFFEKSPENICCLPLFLSSFPSGYFIHVVRNPLFVCRSLIRRGMSEFVAPLVWLFDEAAFIRHADHPRVHTIRYEDLVRGPFEIACRTLKRIDPALTVTTDEVAAGYADNPYRDSDENRVPTWTVQERSRVVDANQDPLSEADRRRFAGALDTRIHPDYAAFFELPAISMREAIRALGYEDDVLSELGDVAPAGRTPHLAPNDRYFYFLKWLVGLKGRNLSISDAWLLQRPVIWTGTE